MQRRHPGPFLLLGVELALLLASLGTTRSGAAGTSRSLTGPSCVPQPAPRTSLVYALADHTLYLGTGGTRWTRVRAGLPGGIGLDAVGLDAVSSAVIYAGTTGRGIYKTLNGGRYWFSANDDSIATTYVYAMAVNPRDNASVYAAGDNAVYHSTDGGITWEQGNIGLPGFLVYALALDVSNPDVVYVGTDTAGVYKSDATFEHWSPASGGLPLGAAVRTLVADPRTPGVLYAGTDVGLFRTGNGGRSWLPTGDLPAGQPVLAVALAPGRGGTLDAGTAGGLYRSADGGSHWTAAAGEVGSAPISALAVDPATPQTIYAATRGAIWRTTNGGSAWSLVNSAMRAASISALAVFHATVTPAWPCRPPRGSGAFYVPQTGHSIAPPFLAFYRAHGGPALFGLPRTEAIVENGTTEQYFENALLQVVGGQVQIASIGTLVTRGRVFNSSPPMSGTAQHPIVRLGTHNVSDLFLRFWQRHGGAAVLGLPISEELHEQNNDGTGTLYQLQYFEKARLDYHPDRHGDAVVQLGKLGDALLRRRGWI